MRNFLKKGGTIILVIFLVIFLARAVNQKELDDLTPNIPCSEELIEKSHVLWVVPKSNGIPISENKEWCNYILNFNKTLGLHGISHNYHEFKIDRNDTYLQEGIDIFEQCFGFKPEMFKPPQLEISKDNKELITGNKLKLTNPLTQVIHKVYHCNDTGMISNKFIDLF